MNRKTNQTKKKINKNLNGQLIGFTYRLCNLVEVYELKGANFEYMIVNEIRPIF